VDVVAKQGICVGIKVDFGLNPLPFKANEQLTMGCDGLLQRGAEFYKNGARFAKARVVFRIQNGRISSTSLTENTIWSAKYALICQRVGLVPIVEPEIFQDGDHSLSVTKYWTNKVLNRMYAALNEYDVDLRGTLLKPSMVLSGSSNTGKRSLRENALATLDVLCNNVPVAVPGCVFLSGGMCEEEASLMLNELNVAFKDKLKRTQCQSPPWSLSFSYGRALQQSAVLAWKGKDSNAKEAQQEFLKRCKANSEAALGRYKGWAKSAKDIETMKNRGYSI